MNFKSMFFCAILCLQINTFLATEIQDMTPEYKLERVISDFNNGYNFQEIHNAFAFYYNNSNVLTLQIKAMFYLGLINYYGRCLSFPNHNIAHDCFWWICNTFYECDDETYQQIKDKDDSDLINLLNRSLFYLARIHYDRHNLVRALDYLSDVEAQYLVLDERSIYTNFFLDLSARVQFKAR